MSNQNRFSPISNPMDHKSKPESYKHSSVIGEYPGNDIRA